MKTVMDGLPELRQDDFDLDLVKAELVLPVAQYLTGASASGNGRQAGAYFVKPLFVSGIPGIGKTTLLMVLDEALRRLGLGSCREMVVSRKITGYFAEKSTLYVTPLTLFGEPTAALSARDWNNILRHWAYDEMTARHSETALADFLARLRGKIVIVDEAELEGYVYFSELLAEHGIQVILSGNLAADQIHLTPDHVRVIPFDGLDHRQGDISRVCLPNAPHPLFDRFVQGDFVLERSHDVTIPRAEIAGRNIIYLNWDELEGQPLMKDDFAQIFVESRAEAVLLDAVPFFSAISSEMVDLTFLGHLSRFANLVDAIYNCQLPLLIRMTESDTLDAQDVESLLRSALMAYDQRVDGGYGKAAWVEWTRCLSRLRSREAVNAAFPFLATP
jgi:hypothetical protein